MSQPVNKLYQPVVLRGTSVDTLSAVPVVFTLAVRKVLRGFSETAVQKQKSNACVKHVEKVPCYLALIPSGPLKHTPHKEVCFVLFFTVRYSCVNAFANANEENFTFVSFGCRRFGSRKKLNFEIENVKRKYNVNSNLIWNTDTSTLLHSKQFHFRWRTGSEIMVALH